MRPLFIAVLAAAAVSSACVDDNPGLVIAGNVKADDTCVFAASASTLVAYGVYDVAIPHPYLVAPLFRSGLIGRGDPTVPRAEPNDIQIEGAVVELTAVGGGGVPGLATTSYSVAMSAFVPAGLDGNAGEATGLVEAIPMGVGAELASAVGAVPTTIVANMTFFGHTMGGTAVDASPWSWTLEVCSGCLAAPCGTLLEGVCFAGQDGYQYLPATCAVP
jgi:hypothetical protein